MVQIINIKFADTYPERNTCFKRLSVHSLTLQIYQEMDRIAGDFPDVASRVKIGHSFEDRPLYILKVRPCSLKGRTRLGLLIPCAQNPTLRPLPGAAF